jgi:hypothetical protein
MMVAILNGLWIWHEFSYDKSFENYDRIAQVVEVGLNLEDGGMDMGGTMTYPLCTELIEKYGQQFKRITRTTFQQDKILTANEIKITSRGLYADVCLELFSFKMIRSTSTLSLKCIQLCRQIMATALFGFEILLIKQHESIINGCYCTGVFELHRIQNSAMKFLLPEPHLQRVNGFKAGPTIGEIIFKSMLK